MTETTTTTTTGNPFITPSKGYERTPSEATTPDGGNPFEVGLEEDGIEEGHHWENEPSGLRSESKFYEIGYYAKYFDINIYDILKRLAKSLIPFSQIFDEDDGGGDLYGPFWITSTAVLTMSIGREFGRFVEGLFKKKEVVQSVGEIGRIWKCASILYGYVLVFPMVLLVLQCTFARNTLEGAKRHGGGVFLNTVAVYGYSMTPLTIAPLVAAVPIKVVQICAIAVAFVLGGGVIAVNLWRDVSIGNSTFAYLIRLLAAIAHIAVGASLLFLFYI